MAEGNICLSIRKCFLPPIYIIWAVIPIPHFAGEESLNPSCNPTFSSGVSQHEFKDDSRNPLRSVGAGEE